MMYRAQPLPSGIINDPEAQARYLLEDGFVDAPHGALAEKVRRHGKLRVKFGVDPTAPAVTWGWTVPLRRLRRFQELGHTAVLVIGDYTAQVGDPAGRSKTRRRLPRDEVKRYVDGCMAGLLEILSPAHLEVQYNSAWLGNMSTAEVLDLTSQATVAQLLERDDFSKRFSAHEPISVTEFIYPLLQGKDSIAVEAQVELGGNDQYFNLMLARDLQQRAGQEPQACVCAPLLVGTDGKKKMSQSYGNYIAVSDPPEEIFGKAMSIPDDAMADYIRLATDLRPNDKARLLNKHGGVKLKRRLAHEMVAMFHGEEAATDAEAAFDRVFVRHEAPSELEHTVTRHTYLPQIMMELGWAASLSDARRGIRGRGVRIDGEVVEDEHKTLEPNTYVLQFGRRRFRSIMVQQPR